MAWFLVRPGRIGSMPDSHALRRERLRTAVAIDPDFCWARVWLGRVYARAGRFPEAIAELREAQRLSPFAYII